MLTIALLSVVLFVAMWTNDIIQPSAPPPKPKPKPKAEDELASKIKDAMQQYMDAQKK